MMPWLPMNDPLRSGNRPKPQHWNPRVRCFPGFGEVGHVEGLGRPRARPG